MRRLTVSVVAAVTVGLVAAPSIAAPKRKPITKTVAFRDATPDPSGIAVGSDGHCSGLLPREKAYAFQAPAAGTLKATIGGFSGEWALQLRDSKDRVLAAQDVNGGFETLSVKVRKPGVVNVLPCNLAGTPDSVITLVFTFA